MHELSLAQGILSVVLDAAGQEPVRRVRLRIGTLQRVAPESLQFSFQLLAESTPAFAGALEIRPVRARIRCRGCGAKSVLKDALFRCRACLSETVEIISGDELIVDAVELRSGWRFRPRPAPPSPEASLDHLREHACYDPAPAGGDWPWQTGPAGEYGYVSADCGVRPGH